MAMKTHNKMTKTKTKEKI